MFKKCLIFLFLLLQYDSASCASITDTKQLSRTLLSNYSTDARPVNNTDSALAITVAFNLISVQELDQKGQNLVLNGLFQFSWTDESLSWNPADYNGLTYIIVQQKRLWLPDLVLRNSPTGSRLPGSPDTPVSVTSQGRVNWNVMGLFTTSCNVDITFFPFDTQVCTVSMSSFIHTNNEIILFVSQSKINLDSYHENSQWKVKSTSASSGTLPTLPVSHAKFDLEVERRASYHILTTIFPIVILSLLTTVVFLVPPDSGERLTLSVVVFLSFVVFLLFLNENVPLTAQNVSIVVVYTYFEMSLAAVAVILSVIVVRTNDKLDMSRVPRWLQTGVKWFRNLFCWTRRKTKRWMFPNWRNHFIVNHWTNRKYDYPTSAEEPEIDWVDVAEVFDRVLYLVFLFVTSLCTIICLSLMIHKW